MARISRAEQLTVINEKLDSSARWRDEMGYDNLWRRMVELYRAKHWPRTTVLSLIHISEPTRPY